MSGVKDKPTTHNIAPPKTRKEAIPQKSKSLKYQQEVKRQEKTAANIALPVPYEELLKTIVPYPEYPELT